MTTPLGSGDRLNESNFSQRTKIKNPEYDDSSVHENGVKQEYYMYR